MVVHISLRARIRIRVVALMRGTFAGGIRLCARHRHTSRACACLPRVPPRVPLRMPNHVGGRSLGRGWLGSEQRRRAAREADAWPHGRVLLAPLDAQASVDVSQQRNLEELARSRHHCERKARP